MDLDYEKLCEQVLQIDSSIRFSGILDVKGEIIVEKNQNQDQLLTEEEVKMSVHYTFERWIRLQNLTYKLGKEKSMVTEYEKVILISLLVKKNLLLVSTEPNSNYKEIIDKIKLIIKNY